MELYKGLVFDPLFIVLRKSIKITGNVRNVGGYVEIQIQSRADTIELFLQELKSGDPSGYEIIKIEVEELSWVNFKDFVIVGSGESDEVSIIPPDLPVCPACQKELYKTMDRRFLNPLISCMSCGPRYTIMEELPYDRENTTMKDFTMCPPCHQEYTSPEDRRFHAQTISCNDCGPYLIFQNNTEINNNQKEQDVSAESTSQEALKKAVTVINAGGILAVKGIGGYHLACSPFQEETVQNLRKLKGREEKPFAVMFETVQSIQEYCVVSKEEKVLLEAKARPIVLLTMPTNTMAPSSNKGSIYCGAFLPYTPLQLLLIRQCGPLIMTSANLTESADNQGG